MAKERLANKGRYGLLSRFLTLDGSGCRAGVVFWTYIPKMVQPKLLLVKSIVNTRRDISLPLSARGIFPMLSVHWLMR